jgi:hypothetical protein
VQPVPARALKTARPLAIGGRVFLVKAMTLNQKREVVRRFKAGESVRVIGDYELVEEPGVPAVYLPIRVTLLSAVEVEDAIRDYLNGKFKLEKKS